MNIMRNVIMICWFWVGVFILNSCNDFLKEESQREVIPKTASDFSELLMGTGYPSVGYEGGPSFSIVALLDDDCELWLTYEGSKPDAKVGTTSAVTSFPIYTWQPYLADYDGYNEAINESPSSTTYASFYKKIMGCNAVLDYIDEAHGDQVDKDRVKAEALAIRSLLYFQLVNLYGASYNYNKEALGVPAKLNADLTEEPIKRATVAYVYEEIVLKGLQEAARLMDPLEIVRKNYRVNQPAIHILLSRVYLYMERYEECIAEVNKAIEQGAVLLDMVNSLDVIPLSGKRYKTITYDNPEVEWLFGGNVGGVTDAYTSGTAPSFRALWDEENDRRWLAFNLQYQGNAVYIMKPSGQGEYGQSVRTAEAYLNRMEAYALSGQEETALKELNDFRKLRIIDYIAENYNGEELLEQIRLERRKELCFEGHRWFDLRRYGMPKIKHVYKYEPGGPTYEFVLEKEDPMYTLPFPNSLLLKNSALIQNESREMPERQGNMVNE